MYIRKEKGETETSSQNIYTNPNYGDCSACGFPINSTPFYDNEDISSTIKATVSCTNPVCVHHTSEVVGDHPPAWID